MTEYLYAYNDLQKEQYQRFSFHKNLFDFVSTVSSRFLKKKL